MASGDFKDLAKRTASDKLLRVKHLILQNTLKMTDIKDDLFQWFTNCLIKRLLVDQLKTKIAEELCKPIIRNFGKGKVHSSFKDNIWVLI